MREILFVLLDDYADWEAAPIAAAINRVDGFCVKTVSLKKEAVKSIGGFQVIPDYDLFGGVEQRFFRSHSCRRQFLADGRSKAGRKDRSSCCEEKRDNRCDL